MNDSVFSPIHAQIACDRYELTCFRANEPWQSNECVSRVLTIQNQPDATCTNYYWRISIWGNSRERVSGDFVIESNFEGIIYAIDITALFALENETSIVIMVDCTDRNSGVPIGHNEIQLNISTALNTFHSLTEQSTESSHQHIQCGLSYSMNVNMMPSRLFAEGLNLEMPSFCGALSIISSSVHLSHWNLNRRTILIPTLQPKIHNLKEMQPEQKCRAFATVSELMIVSEMLDLYEEQNILVCCRFGNHKWDEKMFNLNDRLNAVGASSVFLGSICRSEGNWLANSEIPCLEDSNLNAISIYVLLGKCETNAKMKKFNGKDTSSSSIKYTLLATGVLTSVDCQRQLIAQSLAAVEDDISDTQFSHLSHSKYYLQQQRVEQIILEEGLDDPDQLMCDGQFEISLLSLSSVHSSEQHEVGQLMLNIDILSEFIACGQNSLDFDTSENNWDSLDVSMASEQLLTALLAPAPLDTAVIQSSHDALDVTILYSKLELPDLVAVLSCCTSRLIRTQQYHIAASQGVGFNSMSVETVRVEKLRSLWVHRLTPPFPFATSAVATSKSLPEFWQLTEEEDYDIVLAVVSLVLQELCVEKYCNFALFESLCAKFEKCSVVLGLYAYFQNWLASSDGGYFVSWATDASYADENITDTAVMFDLARTACFCLSVLAAVEKSHKTLHSASIRQQQVKCYDVFKGSQNGEELVWEEAESVTVQDIAEDLANTFLLGCSNRLSVMLAIMNRFGKSKSFLQRKTAAKLGENGFDIHDDIQSVHVAVVNGCEDLSRTLQCTSHLLPHIGPLSACVSSSASHLVENLVIAMKSFLDIQKSISKICQSAADQVLLFETRELMFSAVARVLHWYLILLGTQDKGLDLLDRKFVGENWGTAGYGKGLHPNVSDGLTPDEQNNHNAGKCTCEALSKLAIFLCDEHKELLGSLTCTAVVSITPSEQALEMIQAMSLLVMSIVNLLEQRLAVFGTSGGSCVAVCPTFHVMNTEVFKAKNASTIGQMSNIPQQVDKITPMAPSVVPLPPNQRRRGKSSTRLAPPPPSSTSSAMPHMSNLLEEGIQRAGLRGPAVADYLGARMLWLNAVDAMLVAISAVNLAVLRKPIECAGSGEPKRVSGNLYEFVESCVSKSKSKNVETDEAELFCTGNGTSWRALTHMRWFCERVMNSYCSCQCHDAEAQSDANLPVSIALTRTSPLLKDLF